MDTIYPAPTYYKQWHPSQTDDVEVVGQIVIAAFEQVSNQDRIPLNEVKMDIDSLCSLLTARLNGNDDEPELYAVSHGAALTALDCSILFLDDASDLHLTPAYLALAGSRQKKARQHKKLAVSALRQGQNDLSA